MFLGKQRMSSELHVHVLRQYMLYNVFVFICNYVKMFVFVVYYHFSFSCSSQILVIRTARGMFNGQTGHCSQLIIIFKVVLVSGHLDSWDVGQGAMDDGGGAFISWQVTNYLIYVFFSLKISLQLKKNPKLTGTVITHLYVYLILQALSIIRQLGLQPKRTIRMVLWTAEVLYMSIMINQLQVNQNIILN